MIDFNRHIEIENYLNGDMTPSERSAFEQRLASDDALRQEVDLQKEANLLVKSSVQFDLKNKLKNIHQNQKAEKLKKAKRKKVAIGISAAIIAAAIAAALISGENNTNGAIPNPDNGQGGNITKEVQENEAVDHVNLSDNQVHNVTGVDSSNSELFNNRNEEQNAATNIVDIDRTAVDPGNEPSNTAPLDTGKASSNPEEIPNVSNPRPTEPNPEPNPVEGPTSDEDPCVGMERVRAKVDVKEPCFGGEEGSIKLSNGQQRNFLKYSIDGGGEFVSSVQELSASVGNYNLVAIDENGCRTTSRAIEVKYRSCPKQIQPAQMRYMELELPNSEEGIYFEVMEAKTGAIVYNEMIDGRTNFVYKGINNQRQELNVGGYVYIFKDASGKFITRGNLTIIK